MRRLLVGAGAVSAAVAASAVFGTGVAAAFPDVTGGLFKDAKKTLSEAGYTVVVSGRVGDRTDEDDCVVAHAQAGNALDGLGGSRGQMAMVYLNCYANVASEGGPGYSAGSKQGRAALDAQEEAENEQASEDE